jgi:pre-mRNA-splicing helicase BRR2
MDYSTEDGAVVDPDMEGKDTEIDDELGVAIVFDEEEQEESDHEAFKICDESDDDDDDDDAEKQEDRPQDPGNLGNEELVITGDSSAHTKSKANSDKDIVSPHALDTVWVQCQISEVYPDPITTADKAASILTILGSESSLHDCENQLMELFNFKSYQTITKFLKNHDVIIWCTKLM